MIKETPATSSHLANVGNQFDCVAVLTYATARTAYQAGVARIQAGAEVVNCATLQQFDSAALAVFVAWQREAQESSNTLRFEHIPQQLLSLANAYGIEALLLRKS